MTYVDALTVALDALDAQDEAYAKLLALRNQIVTRNSAIRKPTAKQRANAERNASIGDVALEVLKANGKPMTISELLSADDRFAEVSTQRMSAVLKGLGSQIERSVEKRKAYYKVAE